MQEKSSSDQLNAIVKNIDKNITATRGYIEQVNSLGTREKIVQ